MTAVFLLEGKRRKCGILPEGDAPLDVGKPCFWHPAQAPGLCSQFHSKNGIDFSET